MPKASNDLLGRPGVPGDSREASRTLAFFYTPLYRVLHLSPIEDIYIKDTAEPDPSIPAALSLRAGHHLALSPGHSFSLPDRPTVDCKATTDCFSNVSAVCQGHDNNDAEHFRKIGPVAPQPPREYALQRSTDAAFPAVLTTSLQ
jgi:hypothetical protein